MLTIQRNASEYNYAQWVKTHCYKKWIATPLARNDNFNYAFSYALKNKFEIISRNENYAFDYNKYFCRNGNNRIFSSLRGRSPRQSRTMSSNQIYLDCHADKSARNDKFDGDDLFSRNDYGKKIIFSFWNNLNFGFLFNRKIQQKKLFSRRKKR